MWGFTWICSLFLYGIAQMSVVVSILHVGVYIYIYPIYWVPGNNLVPGVALDFPRINRSNGAPWKITNQRWGTNWTNVIALYLVWVCVLKNYIILTKVDDLGTNEGTITAIRLSLQGQLETACTIFLLPNGLNITTYSYYCFKVIEHM